MTCYEDIDLSCDECYRVTRDNCNAFTMPAGLTPSANVYLILVDKNGVRFSEQVVVGLDGSVTITPDDFGKVISKYGGLYLLVISETEEPVPMTLSVSSMSYECLLLDFGSSDKFCGCS